MRQEGAAQLCLIGPPNAGKSALHVRLTGSRSDIGPYPYTTHLPIPGMLPFEDIHFQLVDLPPISDEFMETWIVNALQPAEVSRDAQMTGSTGRRVAVSQMITW